MNAFEKLKNAALKALPGQRALERAEITELLEESIKEAEFDTHESMLLTNILGLRNITAMDVMVPRADIVSVDISEGPETIFKTVVEANHSRVPVFKASLDEVVGFLHVKDVANCMAEARKPDLDGMMRQPIFIAPTMRALDLLQEMRLKHLHLALVVDEHGGVDGLVTIEDLVEEIVGEINDEHDEDTTPLVQHNGDGTVTVAARVEVDKLEEISGIAFEGEEMEEIDTVGGLVATLAGRVPDRGEIIRHDSGLEFEVLESHPRHVSLVRVCGLSRVAKDARPEGKTPAAKKSA